MVSTNTKQKSVMNRKLKGVLMAAFVSAAALTGTGCASLETAGRTIGQNTVGGVMNSVNDGINKRFAEANGGVWVPNKGTRTTRYSSNGKILRSSASGRGGGKILYGQAAQKYLNKMMRSDIRQAQEIFKMRAEGAYQVTLAYAGADRNKKAAARSVKTITRNYERSIRGYTKIEQVDAAYTRFISAIDKYEQSLEAGQGRNIAQVIAQFSRELTQSVAPVAKNTTAHQH